MQTLGDILSTLDSVDPELVIFAPRARPLTASSPASLVGPDEVAADGDLVYLLEVSIAQDVIEVWAGWRQGLVPSVDERVRAVQHYAEHDAYLPVDTN